MRTELESKLIGEVIAVNHSADACRITIELKGGPAQTAAVMKQSVAELGVVAGAPVCARVDSASVMVDVVHEGGSTSGS